MTLPLPNMSSALVVVKNAAGQIIGKGFIATPWNSWFQQFTEPAPSVVDYSLVNPLTVNASGTIILTGAVTVDLVRGATTINLNGERIIPVSVGDTVSWTGPATVQFLGA